MKKMLILDEKNNVIEKFEIPEYLLLQLRRWKEKYGKDYNPEGDKELE